MVVTLMKVHVVVMPKRSVLDPQGVAVKNALKDLGLDTVDSVRVGKFLELEFKTAPDGSKLEEVCRDLLSNPVIEDYELQRSAVRGQKSEMKTEKPKARKKK
jgi:phosphoribosylformylglycinamidine synthase